MAKKKNSGIFQTESGQWGYRFTLVIEGIVCYCLIRKLMGKLIYF